MDYLPLYTSINKQLSQSISVSKQRARRPVAEKKFGKINFF